MNRFIRISLAALIGFAAPLQAFGWGTVTGARGGTATTGPRGAGYAQGPNAAPPRRAAQGAPATRKVRMAVRPTAAPPAPVPPTARMALRLCEAPTVALLPSVLYGWNRVPCSPFMAAPVYAGAVLQAMGRGTLLRCRRGGRDTWHRNRCRDATAPTVTSLVLVLVEPGAHARLLGLLCPIGDESLRECGLFTRGHAGRSVLPAPPWRAEGRQPSWRC